jgi:two-component system, chemotaxis family, CheB/CheR fusion protein
VASPAQTEPQPELAATVRVVGVGASAGGLVAIEQFLGAMPADSGMAFVVVQHLDPTQRALLPELLQRITPMPVREAVQGARIRPDHVYVIPPNAEIRVVGDTLNLASPAEPRGMRLPVDVLFSSLAGSRGDRSIGVVLSGMGSDGTLGLQAIKAVGGLTAVQEPGSAQFDAMPRSAIESGCADIIGPADALPGSILAVVAKSRAAGVALDVGDHTGAVSAPMQRIVARLRQRTRHDFSLYKASTLKRRVERRIAIHGLASPAQYAEFLDHNPQEIDLLFKELLIGVTSFFRDPAVWDCLADEALPELLARRRDEPHLRAWSVGCSTGEEAYSLAIVFSEALQRLPQPHSGSVQIFASDLSPEAIETARRGRYPRSIADSVSQQRLDRYFTRHESFYQVDKSIRDMVLFAQHDVVLDPPFTRLDLILCRNLLIYFDQALQRRLMPLFHYSLRPGGLLQLGGSETIGRFSNLFSPVNSKSRLYLRQDQTSIAGPDFLLKSFPPLTLASKEHPVHPPSTPSASTDSLQKAADDVLLQVFAPAAVVLNGEGDIVYISGRTGKYLEPAAGKANWNIHAMARDGLRAPLALALKKAAAQREPVQLQGLKVQTAAGLQDVDLTVQSFHDPAPLRGMAMVVFRDVMPAAMPGPRSRRRPKREAHAADQAQLQQYLDEIAALREEARASKEELQSSNEELQSTNEELQSANEELTTSKEEMQSMNEELQTINAELQAKLDDLALAQSDMKNVLNSIEIAILFLDNNLNVRRFTDRAAKLISLREVDIGRPLSELASSLQYPELHEDAEETLRTLAPSERRIETSTGRRFKVRIMPYRRQDNRIDGVVITLLDVTAAAVQEPSATAPPGTAPRDR